MSSDGGGHDDAKINEALRLNLTREMLAEVEETFKMASDSTGMMPSSKISLALRALGMSIHQIDESISYTDGSGIDLDRFIEIVLSCMKQPNWAMAEMNEVFSIIDKDRSGNIDPQELRRIFARLGENLMETEVADQVREFDIDGDYEMALAEFYKMIAATRGSDFIFDDNLS